MEESAEQILLLEEALKAVIRTGFSYDSARDNLGSILLGESSLPVDASPVIRSPCTRQGGVSQRASAVRIRSVYQVHVACEYRVVDVVLRANGDGKLSNGESGKFLRPVEKKTTATTNVLLLTSRKSGFDSK